MKYDFTGKRVFLSGPMSAHGVAGNWNKPAFDAAERKLRELGAQSAFNPARTVPCTEEQARSHEEYMLMTLHHLTWHHGSKFDAGPIIPEYDAILMLEGWRDSIGASVEYAVAKACGIEVLEAREVLG